MMKLTVMGNLGGDAELRSENGKQFVSMSIASTETFQKGDGTKEERTQWISATLNGDGGKLLQYLKKGTKVYVTGDPVARMYHSEKQRQLVAGFKVFIRDIELVSVNTDDVPRTLYDIDGAAHAVTKHFYCPDAAGLSLYGRTGQEFGVDANGWVAPIQQEQVEATTNEEEKA